MAKRTPFYLFVFLIVFVGVFVFGWLFRDSIIFAVLGRVGEVQKEPVKVHLYGNEAVKINNVLVRVYYVATQDNKETIDNWKELFSDVMQKVAVFFELQFGYEMNMAFRVYPQVIKIERPTEYFVGLVRQDYQAEIALPHSQSLAVAAVVDTVRDKAQEEEWSLSVQILNDAYVVNLFVLTIDVDDLETGPVRVLGMNDESNNSVVFSSGFTDEKYRGFYESIVGHEIGHGLGIPRYYSYTTDEVQTSDMMGGGLTRHLKDNYLNQTIKEEMLKR